MPSGYTDATVTSGTTITSTWGNLIRDSVVSSFASSAARDSAIASPVEAQMCWITGTNRLEVYDGAGWLVLEEPWEDYSASQAFTNFTKGNATVLSDFKRQGHSVHWRGSVVLGSTSSITGNLTLTFPYGWDPQPAANGTALYEDAATRYYIGHFGGTFQHTESGNNGTVNATNPFTWTTGDTFAWNIIYEVDTLSDTYD